MDTKKLAVFNAAVSGTCAVDVKDIIRLTSTSNGDSTNIQTSDGETIQVRHSMGEVLKTLGSRALVYQPADGVEL